MHLKNPSWLNYKLLKLEDYDQIPEEYILEIREALGKAVSPDPLVSVVIAAYNEEVNILRCLDSLSKNKSKYPFEVLVVNNNSKDHTQEMLDKIGVSNCFQEIQGPGAARQLGQEKARGKYLLTADADCLYPERWVEEMTKALSKPNVVYVYGDYSFMTEDGKGRWKFWAYEKLRDVIRLIRNFKRPYLNAYGMSTGYVRELGLKEGFANHTFRGEDGRLCFDLMKYGKVKHVKKSGAVVWTGARTLALDGSLGKALWIRILRQLSMLDKYFIKEKPHDTKVSENEDASIEGSLKRFKQKVGVGQKK